MRAGGGTRACVAATLAALLAGACGCSSSVFHHPVTLSTKSDALRIVRRLGPVVVERCDMIVLVVPVVASSANAYDELLGKALRAGGNTVIDFRREETSLVAVPPLFNRVCWRVSGTAALVDGNAGAGS